MYTIYVVGVVVFAFVGIIFANLWVDAHPETKFSENFNASSDKQDRFFYSLMALIAASMWFVVAPAALLAGAAYMTYRWIRTRLDSVRVD